jgi:hypothetical protein
MDADETKATFRKKTGRPKLYPDWLPKRQREAWKNASRKVRAAMEASYNKPPEPKEPPIDETAAPSPEDDDSGLEDAEFADLLSRTLKNAPPTVGADTFLSGKAASVEGPKTSGKAESSARTSERAAYSEREHKNAYLKRSRATLRDIAAEFEPKTIDWNVRHACKWSLENFCLTYMPDVFFTPFSEDHRVVIRKLETTVLTGGTFTVAMPRGHGKTALCRAAILWALLFGHRNFIFNVAANDDKSLQTLAAVKTYIATSPGLLRDFPEVCYPIHRLEHRWHLVRGQIFRGTSTHIEWSGDSITLPSLDMSQEHADWYNQHEPDFVELANGFMIAKTAGSLVRTAGIGGSIRGEALTHPIRLSQPRPDCVILDDVQNDEKAASPTSVDKIVSVIDKAVMGLAGPGQTIAAIMPCTVINENDVADKFLDRMERPEWKGERLPLVKEWPTGINDMAIGHEGVGALWTQYAELRRESLRAREDITLATEFYAANREEMDDGFVVSWTYRYDPDKELSAQQHAMNLRLKAPDAFASEYQQRPRPLVSLGSLPLSVDELARRIGGTERGVCPVWTQKLVGFIDVQNEALYWGVAAGREDFTARIIDYGTWPEIPSRMFTKLQTQAWSLMSRAFAKEYPQHVKDFGATATGLPRAPFEAKIYHALDCCVEMLMNREFPVEGNAREPLRLDKLGIDVRWGKMTDVGKRFAADRRKQFRGLTLCQGRRINPGANQFEQYERRQGWLFEDQLHRHVKEVKWVYYPQQDGRLMLSCDSDRLKTFVMTRLGQPPGSPGALDIFNAKPSDHDMYAQQVVGSEFPQMSVVAGKPKELWELRSSRPDNEYLDITYNLMALLSFAGLSINSDAGSEPRPRGPNRSDVRKKKRFSEYAALKRS